MSWGFIELLDDLSHNDPEAYTAPGMDACIYPTGSSREFCSICDASLCPGKVFLTDFLKKKKKEKSLSLRGPRLCME